MKHLLAIVLGAACLTLTAALTSCATADETPASPPEPAPTKEIEGKTAPTKATHIPFTASSPNIVYTIQSGDTVKSIADSHGVTIQHIADRCGITKDEDLKVGETIDISFSPTDYSNNQNWLKLPEEMSEDIDVFVVYPTVWVRPSEDYPVICPILSGLMTPKASDFLNYYASAFADGANVFAPYYRQLDVGYALTMPDDDQIRLMSGIPANDTIAAFDYYIKNYNKGRPFILAGHSQGSEALMFVMSDYFKAHPEVQEQMIAAYTIGYSITDKYLQDNPHLKFAEGADDTGVIITYNTEAVGVAERNPVVIAGALAINPLTWTRGEEHADISKNLGSLQETATGVEKVAGLVDAQVNLERGTVMVSTLPMEGTTGANFAFPVGVFHGLDFPLFYENLKANCAQRVEAYLAEKSKDAIVETKNGKVQGVTIAGVDIFKGIPFAEPPVGDLRFRAPVAAKSWDGVLECTNFKAAPQQPHTPQDEAKYSEDCLYLNVWRPENAEPDAKLPVLVYIYGGAFQIGDAGMTDYYGNEMAKDGVIQVNISYRVNAFGFMVFEEADGTVVSNLGIQDQKLALKWVQENIAAFGGDPNNVTISGESAGAFSVSNLLLDPSAKGLFHRAIMESGGILCQQITAPQSNGDVNQQLAQGKAFMAELGAKSIDDLRRLDTQKICSLTGVNFKLMQLSPYAFFPTFDGTILPTNPYEAVTNGQFNSMPLLLGANMDEGAIFVPPDSTNEEYVEFIKNVFPNDADAVLARFPVDDANTAIDRGRFIVRSLFRNSHIYYADKFSEKGSDVYFYDFGYEHELLRQNNTGAAHGNELKFAFDVLTPQQNKESDFMVRDSVHNRWVNFIKNSNPNLGETPPQEWPKYTANGQEYMYLDRVASTKTLTAEERSDMEFLFDCMWKNR